MAVSQVHRPDEYRSVSGSRDFQTQVAQPQAILQAEFDDCEVVTVQFRVFPPTGSTGAVPFSCKVTAKFSDGGQPIQRQLHVVNGTMITCVGRILDIRAVDDTPTTTPLIGEGGGAPTPGAGSKYTVVAVAAPGTRPTNLRHPILYNGTYELNASASQIVQIPQDAGVIGIAVYAVAQNTPPSNPNIVMIFEDGSGNIWGQAGVNSDNQAEGISLIPNVTQVQIFNQDTHGVVITVVWLIDG